MRILIVGAGPTGLTAGLELARRGIETNVIDRRAERSDLSRAVGILPRSLEILAPSGVDRSLIEEGVVIREVRAYRGTSLLAEVPFEVAEMRHGHDFILALAQDRTEAHLAEAYGSHGGSIRYGIEFSGLAEEDGRVSVTMADGTREVYDLIIGADGINSGVRNAAGIEFQGYELPEIWSIADVDAPGWMNAGMFTICQLGNGRIMVVVPLEAERYRLVSSTEDALANLPLPMEVSHVRRRARFTISVRQATAYRQGRVILAGDAAHCHSPVGGRGMNLGIADAADLAERMASGTLDGYQAARRAEAARTITLSERVRKTASSGNPLAMALFTGILKGAARFPLIRKRLGGALLYG